MLSTPIRWANASRGLGPLDAPNFLLVGWDYLRRRKAMKKLGALLVLLACVSGVLWAEVHSGVS
jgi:hypothetical protein